MATRVMARALAVLLAAVMPIAFLSTPAQAAAKPKATLSAASSAAAGAQVWFSGKVTKKSSGALVTVQRLEGSVWFDIASTRVKKNKTYGVSIRPAVGKHAYRIRVTGNSKIKTTWSKSRSVTGVHSRSVSYPQPGASVQVSAQTRVPGRVPVEVQQWNGSTWTTLTSGTTDWAGTARLTITTPASMTIRFATPSTSVGGKWRPAWVSPSSRITVASPEVVTILNGINAKRTANKLRPLVLSEPLSVVSQNWSQTMHDSGQFKHNPNFSKQIPGNWRRAAENIAAGQAVNAVVDAWYNSAGHRKNILGDYTHIGIGFVNGTNGYKRYYTTNFAKY